MYCTWCVEYGVCKNVVNYKTNNIKVFFTGKTSLKLFNRIICGRWGMPILKLMKVKFNFLLV